MKEMTEPASRSAGRRPEGVEILRGLIEKIVLSPDADAANEHVIELYGELGSIFSLCGNGLGTNANARGVGAGVRQVTMVAGARIGHCFIPAQENDVSSRRI
ncbi:hypothetical protein [Rhodovulum sulfidophilum]|uniref:hypothetical protein n=1 Tax=Rhodovulum sulfidophilum TaxID=35806 RepID=UPI0019238D01|nr:hypothetical protein [Rhodovulum sulfidophilum]MBL3561120.1 hypothetical protein [Rhodovulum sulfidophilum]